MNENELRLIKMADVELQKVDWLWFPFIPFGKISMIQGDPGEGKTTLALRLAAACSQGNSLPNTFDQERLPINVIYQTAEDGLGDTIKPRLMDARADENRIFCIDESEKSLTLLDERIEKAIDQTGAADLALSTSAQPPEASFWWADSSVNPTSESSFTTNLPSRPQENRWHSRSVTVKGSAGRKGMTR